MKSSTIAVAIVAATAFSPSAALAESRAELAEQSMANTKSIYAQWFACLDEAAESMGWANDRAETIASAALTKCAEWDAVVRDSTVQTIALQSYEMPIPMALESGRGNADDVWADLRSRTKDELILRILEARSGKSAKP